MNKKLFGFIDPKLIMGVVVALIILAVGVFAVLTVVDTTNDTVNLESTSSTNNEEDFEDDIELTNPSDSWYVYTEEGFNGSVYNETTVVHGGEKAYGILDSNGDEDYALFDAQSTDYERVDFHFMVINTSSIVNTSYQEHYNGTDGINPTNVDWYTYSENCDVGNITDDAYQLNGNALGYNLTYDGHCNATNVFDEAKTIDYLWFGFNQSTDDNNDNSGEKVRFMNAAYQEILVVQWLDSATNDILINGHATGWTWTANSWDVITARINWTDHTVSAKWNSEQPTAWYAFNNPAVSEMAMWNFTTNGTGIGADVYLDNFYFYDEETISEHNRSVIKLTKANDVDACDINITASNCTFHNLTAVGFDETILNNTYYRVRLDFNYTDDTVHARLYDGGDTLQAGAWLEMYDGDEEFTEVSRLNVTGISDASVRMYLDDYLFVSSTSEQIDMPDVGDTANSVFTILGIVMIIAAIFSIIGIVSKYT